MMEIKWEDSATVDGWHDEDEYAEPVKCVSVGYLIREEGRSLLLAGTVDENGRWCNGIVIPRSAILSMKAVDPDGHS